LGNVGELSVSLFLLFVGRGEFNWLSAPEESPLGDDEDTSVSSCDEDSCRDASSLTMKSDTSLGSDEASSFRLRMTRASDLPFLAAARAGRLFAIEDDPLGLDGVDSGTSKLN
jgi:hypothetical protein